MILKQPAKFYIKVIPYLMIGITCVGINAWSKVPIGDTFTTWGLNFLFLCFSSIYIYRIKKNFRFDDYIWCFYFLIWVAINVLRGAVIADNYWEHKQLVQGFFMCSLPLLAYVFHDPIYDAYLLRKWNRWMLILYVVFFVWVCSYSCYYFLFPFLLLYGSFYTQLPTKWKLIVGIMLILFCLDLSARSNVIKVMVTTMTAIGFYFRSKLRDGFFRLLHWIIYGMAIFFLIIGVMGDYNILESMSSSYEGQYVKKSKDGTVEDLSTDSRTFIYYEVIQSAVKGKYVIEGITPARGNYSPFFYDRGEYSLYDNLNGKRERHANEMVHLNIFTWLGLIGVILYSLIYVKASYEAIYKSSNIYMKFIGLNIAFHWAYGWIEDVNTFTIQNFFIWMLIAMGLSVKFRQMTDKQYVRWFKSIFA